MMHSIRVRLIECLLMIGGICLAISLAEVAFSLLGLRHVPLRLQGDLPDDIRIFAQSSKVGVVPRDPILLLGDSYAQGFGDWLLEANPNRNDPFHSAHVIQSLTGRDAVTLGRSGAGSGEGLAVLPAVAYAYAKQAWRLRLPAPHAIAVYFYEGNDLNDNISFLKRNVENQDEPRLADRVDRAISTYSTASAQALDWRRHFALSRLSDRILRRVYAEITSAKQVQQSPVADAQEHSQADSPNLVEIGGSPFELPVKLQSPAMELTPMELNRAVLVYERSLTFLRKLLPDAPVLVVYLPSILASYRLLGSEVSIQQYIEGRPSHYPTSRVAEDSNRICLMIRAVSSSHGAGFLDLCPAIRLASAAAVVHGPRDFKHFNRQGMEVLGKAVAERIDGPLSQDPCSSLVN